MIDQLHTDMKIKFLLNGKTEKATIRDIDHANSMIWVECRAGSPRMMAVSYAMIWAIYDETSRKWEMFKLPLEQI